MCPNSGDQLALYCNNLDYYHFARYDGSDENRLYIHIANPETEQVFLGFTHPHSDGHDPSSSRISGYFRIKDPSGTVVYGPQLLDAGNANISTWTQATSGPNEIVGTGGYDAFIFNPDGMAAGDYYVEFNTDATTYLATHLLIEYYDITVANEDPAPVAVTAPGVVEILFDLGQASGAGKYDTGTEDRLLAYEVTPGTGESSPYIRDIPRDGKDGLDANVNTAVPVATEIAFSQGAYHIPVYDVEFNLNGFSNYAPFNSISENI